ncbi:MAG TPA: IclR family transcriptional regulator [Candidatus Dormibacteraeota bacterium]|nr:IclR family transcriptional regulator [Candidatus Dormibacteraeota bacterium]
MTAKRSYNITALQRGLELLKLFASVEGGLSAKKVGLLSGLPVSTVHRFLANLESSQFLKSDSEGVFHLGLSCITLGQAAHAQMDIRRISFPFLQELNQRTRETVHLTMRQGLTAVYVEKLDSPEPLRIHSRIGSSVPLHCTAVGKVLLAHLLEPELEKILRQLELRRFTENTVGSIQELQTQLVRVRRDGFACDLEEHEPHIRCVAAPIWNHAGQVNASLSVTGPLVRMPTTRIRQIAPLIREIGIRISHELGYGKAERPLPKRGDSISARSKIPTESKSRRAVTS